MPKQSGGRKPSKTGGVARAAISRKDRKETERQALMAKLQPHLEHLANNLTSDALDFTVAGVAKAIGVSRGTLYNHGADKLIEEIAARRKAVRERVKKARPGARQAIAALRVEVEEWERKYNQLLDHHTRLIEVLRMDGSVDVTAILATPLPKIDRSAPAKTKRRGSHLRAL